MKLGLWFAAILALSPLVAHAATPDWSIAVYAATDEEDLGPFGALMVKKLLRAPLSDRVQLLVEYDGFGNHGVKRAIRHGRGRAQTSQLVEHDSASPEALAAFFKWAADNSTGRHRLLVIGTHSWGWKGIIQDYTVPGRPDDNTLLPLRDFARVLRESELHPDVLFFDSCILGTVEAIDQLRGTARYIVASERETPYAGFPYSVLLTALGNGPVEPREVARRIPEAYVAAFARDGEYAKVEGEYDIVTTVALDMANWDAFTRGYRDLVGALKRAGLREVLRQQPQWPSRIWDGDHNVDIIELLHRLPLLLPNDEVSTRAGELATQLAYPSGAAEKSAQSFQLDPARMSRFELQLEGDENMSEQDALPSFKKAWQAANQDLPGLDALELAVVRSREQPSYLVRGTVTAPLELRPWLPGTRHIRLSYIDREGNWQRRSFKRDEDYVAVTEFPPSSVLLAEAHSQGAPFIHGLGIDFFPLMEENEERSEDAASGLSGPAFYKFLSWNRRTGWGDLILLRD
ncbi:MAG: hypothetical protein HY074_18580 [Deltaproteobacteria bacterium]|nr:hypothetical protein [Deltaproteobacteria bacterium]